MRIKSNGRRWLGGLVAAAALTASSVASADPPSATWSALRDRQVILEKQSGKLIGGKLIEVQPTMVALLLSDGGTVMIDRASVRSVRARAENEATPSYVPPPAPPVGGVRPTPKRNYGIGVGFGGGVAAATAQTSSGAAASAVGPALLLPTLELQFFMSRGYSIDLTVPVGNAIYSSLALNGVVFNADTFFNFNIDDRIIVGPGLGFSVVSAGGRTASSVRIPGEIGFELLTEGRGFGFKMLARPWLEFGFGSGAESAVGGGVLGVLVFSGYGTTP